MLGMLQRMRYYPLNAALRFVALPKTAYIATILKMSQSSINELLLNSTIEIRPFFTQLNCIKQLLEIFTFLASSSIGNKSAF